MFKRTLGRFEALVSSPQKLPQYSSLQGGPKSSQTQWFVLFLKTCQCYIVLGLADAVPFIALIGGVLTEVTIFFIGSFQDAAVS